MFINEVIVWDDVICAKITLLTKFYEGENVHGAFTQYESKGGTLCIGNGKCWK